MILDKEQIRQKFLSNNPTFSYKGASDRQRSSYGYKRKYPVRYSFNGTLCEYRKVHYWVVKMLGRPMVCSKCRFQSDNPKRIHWANKSGKYIREVSDWVRLCACCHWELDRKKHV